MNSLETVDAGNLDLLASQVVEGFITGLHKSPFHGFSVEFAEHRLYNSGDSLKNVDWKLYGRSDKLFSKKFEEETNLRCQLLMDVSSSMYFPETHVKMKFCCVAIASLIKMLQKQRDAFALTLFSEQMEYTSECKSTVVHQLQLIQKLSQYLQPPQERKPSNISKFLHYAAEMIHRRSLVVIFTDLLDSGDSLESFFESLHHLKFRKHEIIVFHVIHQPFEINFELGNAPVRLKDLETGEELRVFPNELKDSFQTKSKQFASEAKIKCASYGIDFVQADVSKGFNEILLPFYLKRQQMSY